MDKLAFLAGLKQVAIALDQLFNTFLGGYADESLSARAHRQALKGNRKLSIPINMLFFWQKDHCKAAYEAEQARKHLPSDYA